jgi:hypothetical protein
VSRVEPCVCFLQTALVFDPVLVVVVVVVVVATPQQLSLCRMLPLRLETLVDDSARTGSESLGHALLPWHRGGRSLTRIYCIIGSLLGLGLGNTGVHIRMRALSLCLGKAIQSSKISRSLEHVVVYSLKMSGHVDSCLGCLGRSFVATRSEAKLVIFWRTRTCLWTSVVHMFTMWIMMVILNLTLCRTFFNGKPLSSQAECSAQFVQTTFYVGMTMFLDQTRFCRCRLRWPLTLLFPAVDQTPSDICEVDGD